MRTLTAELRKIRSGMTIKQVLTHLAIWTVYFFYENGALMIIDAKAIPLVSSLLFFFLNAFVFYVHTYFILPYTNHRKQILLYMLLALLLLGFYIERSYFMTNYLREHGIAIVYTVAPLKNFLVIRIFRFIYIITISYLFWLYQYKIRNDKQLLDTEKNRIALSEEMMRLEKEKVQIDLNFLRAQINPHFLFNTLSFIYTEVLPLSEKTAESILLLSDIMSFALSPVNRDEKIPILQEIEHIESLIKIHQLRFDQKLAIKLELPQRDLLKTVKVPALLLITFVENVFKYGDFSNPEEPCVLTLEFINEQIKFVLSNKKNHSLIQAQPPGIGIANAVNRLKLIYGAGHYKLDIFDNHHYYTVSLIIHS